MIAVTGATGKLGRHVIDQLLDTLPPHDLAPEEIVAAVRNTDKAADLAERGVQVRYADYDQPDSLEAAFAGVEQVLLISASELGRRAEQHQAVIDAAKKAGVGRLVYTSLLQAGTSTLSLAEAHRQTEAAIEASGIPAVILRNGWYIENYTENLGPALERGAMIGCAGRGLIGAATREDFAAAAVAALTHDEHTGKTYELAGDEAFTMEQLARAVSLHSGKTVDYRDVTADEYRGALQGAGLPEPVVEMLVTADVAISKDELDDRCGDLRELIRRPTTTLDDVLSERFG